MSPAPLFRARYGHHVTDGEIMGSVMKIGAKVGGRSFR